MYFNKDIAVKFCLTWLILGSYILRRWFLWILREIWIKLWVCWLARGQGCEMCGDVCVVGFSKSLFIPFSGSLLLESKINPNTAYQKQQASIIAGLSFLWLLMLRNCFVLRLIAFFRGKKGKWDDMELLMVFFIVVKNLLRSLWVLNTSHSRN